MNTIELQQTLPEVFAGRDSIVSDIWHKQVALQRGKTYLIEAASGTGKSSLCSFIYGYRRDYQGIICFDGENIRNYSVFQWVAVRKRSISMLFQELRLFGELTAWENVQLKNTLTGYADKKQIRQWFEALGISDKWNERIDKMSFGQQQRVAFIRALCQPFDFIFLDEPISHLDDGNSRIMSEILIEETKKQGAGIVVTSIGKHLPLNYDRIISL
ncbi:MULTISPECIES: ATP-binding cassette domain-containing protein [Phocaeicola]|uniref:ATP-binding cassette domain-containing protein n=1 Tax=Phocaeicola faecium TaxID=2762213 RepID=A0ABR8V8W7_9BACT|nr:ATP-binding cassette domain-containing protein [uncultured Phocaeicola sp.]MBD8001136.1 ATP-binding cassette domain-containing protein [Phocaeicola faecium]